MGFRVLGGFIAWFFRNSVPYRLAVGQFRLMSFRRSPGRPITPVEL